jgi:hypothetical protein
VLSHGTHDELPGGAGVLGQSTGDVRTGGVEAPIATVIAAAVPQLGRHRPPAGVVIAKPVDGQLGDANAHLAIRESLGVVNSLAEPERLPSAS